MRSAFELPAVGGDAQDDRALRPADALGRDPVQHRTRERGGRTERAERCGAPRLPRDRPAGERGVEQPGTVIG